MNAKRERTKINQWLTKLRYTKIMCTNCLKDFLKYVEANNDTVFHHAEYLTCPKCETSINIPRINNSRRIELGIPPIISVGDKVWFPYENQKIAGIVRKINKGRACVYYEFPTNSDTKLKWGEIELPTEVLGRRA